MANRDIPAVCLIGVTGFGHVHYNDLTRQHDQGLMRLAAATIVNPRDCPEQIAALRRRGCEIFDNYQAMLAAHRGRCDICFVPTGIHMHRPMAIAALEAGMNVYVEKPAAAAMQDVRAMKAAAARAGRWVAVGFQTMYSADAMAAKEFLLSGRLGAVKSINFYALWPRGDAYYARNNWAGRLKAGDTWVLDSPFNNAIAHQLNLILFFAGAALARSATPARVQAELYRARPIESADTCALRVFTREGPVLHTWLSHVPDRGPGLGEGEEGPVVEARCEKGSLRWSFKEMRLTAADGEVVEMIPGQRGPGGRDIRPSIMDRLRLKLVDPAAFVCDLDIAGAHTAVVNAVHDAAAPRDFPAELIRSTGPADNVMREVDGLSGLVRRAFAEEKLFAEMGLPWAGGGEADAEGYAVGDREFPARPSHPGKSEP